MAAGVEKFTTYELRDFPWPLCSLLASTNLRAVNDNNGACENLTPQKLCISQGMRCEANYESTSSYELTIDHRSLNLLVGCDQGELLITIPTPHATETDILDKLHKNPE